MQLHHHLVERDEIDLEWNHQGHEEHEEDPIAAGEAELGEGVGRGRPEDDVQITIVPVTIDAVEEVSPERIRLSTTIR